MNGKKTAFASELLRLRLATGRSGSNVARQCGVDASYLSRMERGEREAPTRSVVLALRRALLLTYEDTDRLLTLAGHNTPLLERTAALTTEPRFRQVLAALVDAWEPSEGSA